MNITIQDTITDPEVIAMLQSFYSRSHMGINERIHDLGLDQEKIKKAIQLYYLGYGHASIGDCGWTTLFIEDVSLLAAKAIQHHPLYNGQEKSTRYLNFTGAESVYNPFTGKEKEVIDLYLTTVMENYQKIYQQLLSALKLHYPQPKTVKDTVYNNTLQCAALDTARGLLPAGLKTSLSWTGHLRSIREHSLELLQHPFPEVQQLAKTILKLCHIKFPSTFADSDVAYVDEYTAICTRREKQLLYYLPTPMFPKVFPKVELDSSLFNVKGILTEAKNELCHRPKDAKLPRYLNQYGTLTAKFWLDFGSFRDLQRHRNGTILMPEFIPNAAIHPFYIEGLLKEMLPSEQYDEFLANHLYITTALARYTRMLNPDDLQYLYPLGWLMPVRYTATLSQWVYMIELRTKQTVHQTLRAVMIELGKELKRLIPYVNLYMDQSEKQLVNWQRGAQTIEKRTEDHVGATH